ncbi:hypothetical protein EV182_004955, partial [Spiromyces aspiralis]
MNSHPILGEDPEYLGSSQSPGASLSHLRATSDATATRRHRDDHQGPDDGDDFDDFDVSAANPPSASAHHGPPPPLPSAQQQQQPVLPHMRQRQYYNRWHANSLREILPRRLNNSSGGC